jgi:purine-binding chemotaxis protein CheW
MPEWTSGKSQVLVVEIEGRICALPLTQVIETMRPLSVESVANVPLFVSGVAIIRGIPTPVVDLGAILGRPNECVERFVTVRVGDRQMALSVSKVLGVRNLNSAMIEELPPLLKDASKDAVEAIGTLDERALMILRAGWDLPTEVWQALTVQETVS